MNYRKHSLNGNTYSEDVYIIEGPCVNNLLSQQAACWMGLVQRFSETTETIYGDVGLMDCDAAKIELLPNTQPYCINAARKIPFPLFPKVKEEFAHMLEAGIIEEVIESTDCCAPMLPVVKPNSYQNMC